MCMWVSSFLPFYANDVLGDVEWRRLSAYVVMVAGGITFTTVCSVSLLQGDRAFRLHTFRVNSTMDQAPQTPDSIHLYSELHVPGSPFRLYSEPP